MKRFIVEMHVGSLTVEQDIDFAPWIQQTNPFPIMKDDKQVGIVDEFRASCSCC